LDGGSKSVGPGPATPASRLTDRIWRERGGWYEIRSVGLRRAVDLQFRSILSCLSRGLEAGNPASWRVLDVGAGSAPYRKMFAGCREYVTMDPHGVADYASLEAIPSDRTFDRILILEVLEHVRYPAALLKEVAARLAPGGEIWISVPFAARVHRVPEDYWRWAPAGLEALLEDSGLQGVEILARGSGGATLISKVILGLARGLSSAVTAIPAAAGLALALPVLGLGHRLSRPRPAEGVEDPLGFFVVARR